MFRYARGGGNPAAIANAKPLWADPDRRLAYELKFDGFRAIVGRHHGFQVRSRRGWNMTDRLPELANLPAGGVFDGEIVAFDEGVPHFPLVCDRLLHGDRQDSAHLRGL